MKNFTEILADIKSGLIGGNPEPQIQAASRRPQAPKDDPWGSSDEDHDDGSGHAVTVPAQAQEAAAPSQEVDTQPAPQIPASVATPPPTLPPSRVPAAPTPADVEQQWGKHLATYPEVAAALTVATAAAEAYARRFDELAPAFDSEATLRQARRIMATATSAEAIAEATRKMSVVESPSFKAAAGRAQVLMKGEFAKVQDSAIRLLRSSLAPAAELEKEVVKAETEFFAEFGLPREETSVCRRVRQFTAKLSSHLAGLQQHTVRDQVAPRDSLRHILEIFQ